MAVKKAQTSKLNNAGRAFSMLAFALVLGFAVGVLIRAVLFAVSFATGLLWNGTAVLGVPWAPFAVCVIGGLFVGLWSARFGGAPEALPKVMASIRQNGSYRVRSMPSSIVGFALPLVFGGAIGPEAGLAGIIASLCGGVANMLQRAGLRVQSVADVTVSAVFAAVFGAPFAGIVAGDDASKHHSGELSPRRGAKVVLYASAAAGGFAGMRLFSSLSGAHAGLPSIPASPVSTADLPWAFACLAAAWALAVVYQGAHAIFAKASALMGEHPIAKPLICGIALGVFAVVLPLALFSGEDQIAEIALNPMALSATAMIGAAVAKAVLTPLCLEFGWRGGHFFPCIFMGVALGFGIGSFVGADPVFCASITAGAFLACTTRRPLLSATLLLLCFPLQSLAWLVLAAFIGAHLPLWGENAHGAEPPDPS